MESYRDVPGRDPAAEAPAAYALAWQLVEQLRAAPGGMWFVEACTVLV